MIASLRGLVVGRGADHVVVEVGGVGYKVFVPRHPTRNEVHLHTHQVVREDGAFLYGFETREELELFEMLIAVSGVGPKAALALLATASPAELAGAIAAGDAALLARAPGVGKKTAERLIVDLRSKVGGVGRGPAALPGDELAAALIGLGYSAAEATEALRHAPAAGAASAEERLAAALRAAGNRA